MVTKKLTPKKNSNPKPKWEFKRTCITISEVENGFEVEVQWAFNNCTSSARHDQNYRDYVAKSEDEALELVRKLVPTLVEDDEEVDEDK